MGRLIEFYIPDNFNPQPRRKKPLEGAQVIQFPANTSDEFRQATWIFPEVDADLA